MLSIICKSRRPQLWQNFYKMFETKNKDFEIIFIGPYKPKFVLPKNSKFIHSIVKPPQCTEIAYSIARGDYLMEMGDDLFLKIDANPTEKIYDIINNYSDENFLITHKCYSHGDEITQKSPELNNMLVPWSPVFSKKIYKQTGGIDRRFIAVMFEVDLYLRMLQLGCKVINSGLIFEEKIRKRTEPSLYNDYAKKDKDLFKKLWFKNEKLNINIQRKLSPYSFEKINLVSQDPKGKWKFKNFLLFYFIDSSYFRFFLKLITLNFNFLYNISIKYKDNSCVKFLLNIRSKLINTFR